MYLIKHVNKSKKKVVKIKTFVCVCVCSRAHTRLPGLSFHLTSHRVKQFHMSIDFFPFRVTSCVHLKSSVFLTRRHVAQNQRTWYNFINNYLPRSFFFSACLLSVFSLHSFCSSGTLWEIFVSMPNDVSDLDWLRNNITRLIR